MSNEPEMTPEEMRAHIEEAPFMEGRKPWEGSDMDTGYELAGRGLAHAFLILVDEDPSLLEVPSRDDDPSGHEAATNEKLWQAFKERWPDGDEWLGGITGFQFGWAHNAVRYAVGAKPVGNPAIVTVSTKDE